MPNRNTPIEIDSIYHIYNRGVNKELIFFSDRNYQFFLYKLAHYLAGNASILAYCLMPNHFHLLVKINNIDFIKMGLQSFLIAYTRAVNIDQKRVGPLFQGRYQSNLIDSEDYLLECVKYIHLNPVKAGLIKNPVEWKYSSYHDYFLLHGESFVDKATILSRFDSVADFKTFSESDMLHKGPIKFIDYQ